MSDIGLLMAGVLAAGQPSAPKLPEQPPIKVKEAVNGSAIAEGTQVIQPAEMTPPEFLPLDGSPQSAPLAIKIESKKIFSNITEKKHPQTPYSLVQAVEVRRGKEDKGDKVEFSPSLPHSPENDPMSQVTSVSQLGDIQPSDWAFSALQSLVERYGCIAGYPDRTYRGNRAINRYEFAAGLAACLEKISELIGNSTKDALTNEDLILLEKLQLEFQAELKTIQERVASLEGRTSQVAKNQFSTTTKLVGQVIFGLQGSNKADIDLFPRDGIPERNAQTNFTFANNVQLTLATSFTGRDLLLTGLTAGNLGSNAPFVFTNMGRLGYELDTDKDLVLNELSYRFPVSNNFGIVVGTAGVNPSNTFRGINPLEGSGEGAISLFGQRNPILAIGNGTGGIGFDWQISDRISLQGVYSAEIPSFPNNAQAGGLFGGRYTAGAQLSLAPTNNIDVGIHYLYSHSPDGLLGTGIGDAQLISPFAPPVAFNTHAVGATVAWRINPNFQLGGWGGWTFSNPEELSGSVKTTNWMAFAAFPNLLRQGNLGGILVGQPPKITSSTLPEEYNLPNFSEGGTPGGRSDSALHLELFYRAQLNEYLSITPGLLVLFNPDHNSANDTLVIGTVRATFRF
ncbi:S-layer protein [Scytonema hofmannii PCC 7110]|uniref:S-layer protein n=1 Tax=Scytonema hofmannii PCC 7110 TaxID=128403 RepID=A0A139X494_9CYAN|nr:iron uptake porin [Scytonema hofmannii]KYC39500.1 S-layer protein [Scytonema hofmannii PCC 7110]